MSDNKKYYYLKLKENFFDSEQLLVLESMPDGYLYSNILIKLYLRSLKNNGKLMFNDRIPYNSAILSQVVRHPVGVVEKAISIYKEFGLIEIMDNGAIYMLDIQNYIGQSSTEADRQREYQHRINVEKGLLLIEDEECKKSNKKSCKKSNMKSTPEIEIEKDIEIDNIPYIEIIDYLNLKANTRYRSNNAKTKALIKTRWNENFTLEDFKIVIDNKCKSWLGTEQEKYIRPETLFGTKFESYLNEKSRGDNYGHFTRNNQQNQSKYFDLKIPERQFNDDTTGEEPF